MQLPTKKTPVDRCVELGNFTHAMLTKFTTNVVLAAAATKLLAVTSKLKTTQTAYKDAKLAKVVARAGVRYADYSADNKVRGTLRRAEDADGEKGGPIAGAVFPGGVTPIVRPVGDTQCKEMADLEGRLEAASPIWADAAAEKAKIAAERGSYETALEERKTANQTETNLKAARDAAKEEFLDVYAMVAAKVKGEFPRKKKMQDFFFDKVTTTSAEEEDDGDEDPEEPGGGAPPGSAG